MKYGIEVYNVELLLREPLTDERSMQLLPILLPHELVAAVFRYGWSTFSKVFFNGLPEGRQSNSVLIVGVAFYKQHQIFLGSRAPGAPECRVQDPPLIKIWCQCLVATLSYPHLVWAWTARAVEPRLRVGTCLRSVEPRLCTAWAPHSSKTHPPEQGLHSPHGPSSEWVWLRKMLSYYEDTSAQAERA
jgi:hypothetical protein